MDLVVLNGRLALAEPPDAGLMPAVDKLVTKLGFSAE